MKGSKGGKKAGKEAFKKLGAPKRAGKKSTDKVKIHAIKPRGNQTVWGLETALRKDGYFARAIGPAKVVTNAPIKTP
jgi:hypothetical protein